MDPLPTGIEANDPWKLVYLPPAQCQEWVRSIWMSLPPARRARSWVAFTEVKGQIPKGQMAWVDVAARIGVFSEVLTGG